MNMDDMIRNKAHVINYDDSFKIPICNKTLLSILESLCIHKDVMSFYILKILQMRTGHNKIK